MNLVIRDQNTNVKFITLDSLRIVYLHIHVLIVYIITDTTEGSVFNEES